MNELGEIIDTEDIITGRTRSSRSTDNDIKVIVKDNINCEDDDNPIGEIILPCQVKTYRRKKSQGLGISDDAYVRVRQNRSDNGRAHGKDTSFALTDEQLLVVKHWKEIERLEDADDWRKFMNRLKRNNSMYRK